MSLMDALNKKIVDRRNRQMTGGTEAASRLLAAKSGKAVTDLSEPARSSLGEAMASQQAQGQVADVQKQSDLATMGQAEQGAAQVQQADMASQGLQNERNVALVEQQAQNEALADKKYLARLDRAGRKSLMQDGIINREKFIRTQLGDATELLRAALGDAWLIGKEQVDNQVARQKLAAYWDVRLAEPAQDAAAYAQQTQMIGSLITSSAQMYGAYENQQTENKIGAAYADKESPMYDPAKAEEWKIRNGE